MAWSISKVEQRKINIFGIMGCLHNDFLTNAHGQFCSPIRDRISRGTGYMLELIKFGESFKFGSLKRAVITY